MKVNRFPFILVFAVAIMAAPAGTGFCGIVLTDADGGKTFISHGKIKEAPAHKGDEYAITDLNQGTLTIIRPEKKQAAVGTVDEFCTIMDQIKKNMAEVMEEIKKQMKSQNMPPDMPGMPATPPHVRVENKGRGQSVAGYETVKYLVYADDRLYEELWFTRDNRLLSEAGDPEQMARFETCASAIMGPGAVEGTPEHRELVRTGWLLKAISYENEEKNILLQVESIEDKDIPQGVFAVPDGYERISLTRMFEGEE